MGNGLIPFIVGLIGITLGILVALLAEMRLTRRRCKQLEDDIDLLKVFDKNLVIDVNRLRQFFNESLTNPIVTEVQNGQSPAPSGVASPPPTEVIDGLEELLKKVWAETDKQSTPDPEPKKADPPSRMIRFGRGGYEIVKNE